MTRDEILAAAREAGFKERNGIVRTMHSSGAWVGINEEIERFAALVAAAEREACALECERIERAKWESVIELGHTGRIAFAGPMQCAVAIRARSNPTAGTVPASKP